MNFTNFLADTIPRCFCSHVFLFYFKSFVIMNKEVLKIIIKVLIYALGLIGTYFGVSAMTSCTVQRQFDSYGKGTIILSDTTSISHSGSWFFKHIR